MSDGVVAPAEQPARRAYPWEYAAQVVSELRASSWPSWRTVVSSSLLVLGVVVTVTLLVSVADAGFINLMLSFRESVAGVVLPDPARYALLGLHVVSLVATIVLTLRGPAPSGGLASVFGGGVSEGASGRTPSERHLSNQTMVAGAALVVLTVLAGAFF